MADNWVDAIFESEWFLVEDTVKAIGDGGYPEIYYDCYISTSPHKDKARAGHRLINPQRWFGPKSVEGVLERRLLEHLVNLHNASIKFPKVEVDTETYFQQVQQPVPEKKKRKPLSPEAKEKRRKQAIINLSKRFEKKKEEVQTPTAGVVQEGLPVQAQDSPVAQEVQAQEETQKPGGMTTACLS